MVNWAAIDPQSVPGKIVRLPSRLLPKSTIMRIRRGPAQGNEVDYRQFAPRLLAWHFRSFEAKAA
jgi:hypothetical protein